MSRRSALSAFPTIRMPSHSFGERSKSSLLCGRMSGHAADDPKFSLVDRESDVAGVGQGEPRSARTVSPGGRPTRRSAPGRRSHRAAAGYGQIGLGGISRGRSRRQESGDTAGAWDCYRARPPHVSPTSGGGETRISVMPSMRASVDLQRRLTDWAADPRTTIRPASYRPGRSAREPSRSPIGISLQLSMGISISCDSWIEPVNRPFEQIEGEWTFRLGDMAVVGRPDRSSRTACTRFLLREPERSRRVLRLLCANCLAHVENPECRRGNRPSGPVAYLIATTRYEGH